MKVLISATSFSTLTPEPEDRLRAEGYEIIHVGDKPSKVWF